MSQSTSRGLAFDESCSVSLGVYSLEARAGRQRSIAPESIPASRSRRRVATQTPSANRPATIVGSGSVLRYSPGEGGANRVSGQNIGYVRPVGVRSSPSVKRWETAPTARTAATRRRMWLVTVIAPMMIPSSTAPPGVQTEPGEGDLQGPFDDRVVQQEVSLC
jgi:hypothetical protein